MRERAADFLLGCTGTVDACGEGETNRHYNCACYAPAMLVYARAGVCLVVGPLWMFVPFV